MSIVNINVKKVFVHYRQTIKKKLTPPTTATGIVLIMAANLGIQLSTAAYTAAKNALNDCPHYPDYKCEHKI